MQEAEYKFKYRSKFPTTGSNTDQSFLYFAKVKTMLEESDLAWLHNLLSQLLLPQQSHLYSPRNHFKA